MTMADKVKGSTSSHPDKTKTSGELFLQDMKQIMSENPRLYSKLAKL